MKVRKQRQRTRRTKFGKKKSFNKFSKVVSYSSLQGIIGNLWEPRSHTFFSDPRCPQIFFLSDWCSIPFSSRDGHTFSKWRHFCLALAASNPLRVSLKSELKDSHQAMYHVGCLWPLVTSRTLSACVSGWWFIPAMSSMTNETKMSIEAKRSLEHTPNFAVPLQYHFYFLFHNLSCPC